MKVTDFFHCPAELRAGKEALVLAGYYAGW